MVCFVNVESVDRINSIFQRFNLEWKTRTLNFQGCRHAERNYNFHD